MKWRDKVLCGSDAVVLGILLGIGFYLGMEIVSLTNKLLSVIIH